MTPAPSFLLCVLALAAAVQGCSSSSDAELIQKGQNYIAQKNYKAAGFTFKAALQNKPESAELRFLLGQSLQLSGEHAQAVVELNKALELGHNEAQVVPVLASALIGSGKADQVVQRYATATLPDTKASAELKVMLAIAYGALGREALMASAVGDAMLADPRNAKAKMLSARLMAERRDFDSAWNAVLGILSEDQNSATAWQLKGLLLRWARNDTPGAMVAFRRALQIEPALVSAHAEILSILFSLGDKTAMREQILAMQKSVPNAVATHIYRAQIEYLEGNFKPARELVQQLLRADKPNPNALLLAALIEYRAGSLAVVETHLNRVLLVLPQSEAARILLAGTHLRGGQLDKAIAALSPLLDSGTPSSEVLGVAAETYLRMGDLPKAEGLYKRAATLKPDEVRLKTALALAKVSRGEEQIGFDELARAAAADKGTFADLALVSAYLQRNSFDLALKALERLELKIATKPLPYDLRGRIFLRKRDLTAARQNFTKALEVDPSYFSAAASLAAIDLEEKKPEDAKRRFENLLKVDSQSYRASLALAGLLSRERAPSAQIISLLTATIKTSRSELEPRLVLIEHYVATGDPKAAIPVAQEALIDFPDNVSVLDALGRALALTKEYQQSISAFRKLAALQPNSPHAHLRMAEMYWAKKEPEAAQSSLKRALEIAPNLLAAQVRQVAYAISQKRYVDALEVAQRVQASRPKDAVGFLLAADVLTEQKMWDDAISSLRKALQLSKTSAIAIKLHSVLYGAGKKDSAEKFGRQWIADSPDDVSMLFQLSGTALVREDWTSAETLYRRMIVLDSSSAIAHNNLSWVLAKQKKPGALASAQRAAELLPNDPTVLDTLSTALADDGQLLKALEIQKKAVAGAPGANHLRLNLARLALKLDDKSLARAELEKLAYLGDKFNAQGEVAQLLRALH